MHSQHITPRPLLAALACVIALAWALPAVASAQLQSERAGDGPAAQSIVADRPSERGTPGEAAATPAGSSDDGADVALIVGLSLAGLAAGGATWFLVRRHHHGPLTPRGSA
jgi:hypothetical protein